ncbi:hypothetical protein RHECIAT_CH0002126 [Rhizobium etli CIAT 652]|uniref:Uncharacterized protein n=1 Tax=Rhizobium etli (strain CIAT 652) TaxID=491916 RepID=B3PZL9_RHIE6|nr:hypothetical protein RHECIAT_CH0002126 [Rhizobium etli CIAT 652]
MAKRAISFFTPGEFGRNSNPSSVFLGLEPRIYATTAGGCGVDARLGATAVGFSKNGCGSLRDSQEICRFTVLTHYFRDKANDGETWHRRRREFRGENFAKNSIFAYVTRCKVDTYFPVTLYNPLF